MVVVGVRLHQSHAVKAFAAQTLDGAQRSKAALGNKNKWNLFCISLVCTIFVTKDMNNMKNHEIYSASGLMELIGEIGFLPLLDSGIGGFSAGEMVTEDCQYVTFPEGGWDWPLWKWKGEIVTGMPCVYGKFFNKKAGFISMDWWPDFCNYRRSLYPRPDDDSIEGTILATLQSTGSLITRELRAACGFGSSLRSKTSDGLPKVKGLRSKFDGFLTRLEMATYIVTEDFVYPRDKHNREYGWGWSLLNTPEALYGSDACRCGRSPEESRQRMFDHLRPLLPDATDKQLNKLIG